MSLAGRPLKPLPQNAPLYMCVLDDVLFIEVAKSEVDTMKSVKIQFSLQVRFYKMQNGEKGEEMDHYFNRMQPVIITEHNNTELFADDSVLHRKITTEDDCVKFQDDLLSAASWCDLWKVTLKSEKCKSLHVTKSKCPLVHPFNRMQPVIITEHNNTELFADDSVLYRKITTEDNCVKFQDDLLSAASWCDLWKVTLKSEKCKSLHVTKSKCPLVHQYVINDVNLSIVNKHKHLGIWIESSLGWDSHINYIVGKANRVLGLIRRTFGSKDPVAVKTAYNVLVSPILEYVKSYSERLAELNWSTLELRRKYLCLVQLYKIIHGFSDVDYTRYIALTGPTRTRRNHYFKIRPRAVRTNYFKFFFFNRYVNDWNSLPNSVMSASSLNAFKNRLLNYLCT